MCDGIKSLRSRPNLGHTTVVTFNPSTGVFARFKRVFPQGTYILKRGSKKLPLENKKSLPVLGFPVVVYPLIIQLFIDKIYVINFLGFNLCKKPQLTIEIQAE